MARFSLLDVLSVLVVSLSAARLAVAEPSRGPSQRYTADKCASLKINVAAELNRRIHANIYDSHREEQACLCFSSLNEYIEKNLEANYAMREHGRSKVVNAFKKMIEDHNPNSCMLPDNAESACEAGNVCAFTCKNPYVKPQRSNTCVLGAAPSQKPKPKRGLELIMDTQSSLPCPSGHQLCPVWRHTQIMECVDIRSDLFSCGGCMYQDLEDEGLVSGEDCSVIEGVSDVSCVSGKCRVRKCMKGYTVAANGTTCNSVL